MVADETWIGGTPKNRHGHKSRPRKQGQGDKTSVLSLVSRETGEVRSKVVPNVTAATLERELRAQTDVERTFLHTDSLPSYKPVGKHFAGHSVVDHTGGEYVASDGATTNHAETYFSQLKRSIDGTHHHVSREHLDRYLAEFDYRYTTCKISDTERMKRLAKQVFGRRLTYRPVG